MDRYNQWIFMGNSWTLMEINYYSMDINGLYGAILKWVVPQNGQIVFARENTIKMKDDWGYLLFQELPYDDPVLIQIHDGNR